MKKRKLFLGVITLLALCTTACNFKMVDPSSSKQVFESSQISSSKGDEKSSSSSLNPAPSSSSIVDQPSSSSLPSPSSSSINPASSSSNKPSSSSSAQPSSSSAAPSSSSAQPSSSSAQPSSSSNQPSSSSSSKPSSSSSSSKPSSSSSSSRPSSSSSAQPSSSSSSKPSSSSSSSKTSSSSGGSSSSSQNPRPTNVTLDIYGFNDNHGVVKDTEGKGIGIAKLTTFAKEMSAGKNAVFISQGDMWQGSVESNFTKGNLMTEWMNQLGFVSMTVGNHEYDWGSEYIIQNQQLANFPTLGINVLKRSDNKRVDYLSPSVTFEKAGAKIGVIGAIGNCLSSISGSKVKDVYFATGEALTNLVKEESNRLRNNEHCDFIIYSIHGDAMHDPDDSYDISLSTGNYVDLVLEGHTHQGYYYEDDGGVFHIQNLGDSKSVYDVTVNLNLEAATYTVVPTLYDTSYYSDYIYLADDATTLSLIDKYYDCFSFAYEELGVIDGFKDPNTIRSKVADLYLEVGTERWGSQYNLICGGGYMSCRGDGLHAGSVHYSDISQLLPFDNELVLCSIRGSDLANTQFIQGATTYFVAWSEFGENMRYNIDYSETYYLISDTYSSDYAPNHLTVVDNYDVGVYARDLLAMYIQEGGWAYVPPTSHAGTLDDPKTIQEALDQAALYTSNYESPSYFFKGVVSRVARRVGSSGDLGNVYVSDANTGYEIQLYWVAKNQYRTSVFTSVDELAIGDEVVFYGSPFTYVSASTGSRTPEFTNNAGDPNTWIYSINSVSTN